MEATNAAPVPPSANRRSRVRRWAAVWVPAAVLLLTVLVLYWPFFFGTRLKSEHYDLIQAGMTQPEVEALLGGAPGAYRRPEKAMIFTQVSRGYGNILLLRQEHWSGDRAQIVVFFDDKAKVYSKEKFDLPPVSLNDWNVYYWRALRRRSTAINYGAQLMTNLFE